MIYLFVWFKIYNLGALRVGHEGFVGPKGPKGEPGATGLPGLNCTYGMDNSTSTIIGPKGVAGLKGNEVSI